MRLPAKLRRGYFRSRRCIGIVPPFQGTYDDVQLLAFRGGYNLGRGLQNSGNSFYVVGQDSDQYEKDDMMQIDYYCD